MRSLFFLFLVSFLGCGRPAASPPDVVAGHPMITVTRGVYADPATPAEDREKLARWQAESTQALADFFYGVSSRGAPTSSRTASSISASPTRRSPSASG